MHKVENAVNHLHETVVNMLELKIDSRIGALQRQLSQHLELMERNFVLKEKQALHQQTGEGSAAPEAPQLSKRVSAGATYDQPRAGSGQLNKSADAALERKDLEIASLKQEIASLKQLEQAGAAGGGSALKLISSALHKWPAYMEGPRSSLGAIKFGLEIQSQPLVIHL